jgi:hypothetical protein
LREEDAIQQFLRGESDSVPAAESSQHQHNQ